MDPKSYLLQIQYGKIEDKEGGSVKMVLQGRRRQTKREFAGLAHQNPTTSSRYLDFDAVALGATFAHVNKWLNFAHALSSGLHHPCDMSNQNR